MTRLRRIWRPFGRRVALVFSLAAVLGGCAGDRPTPTPLEPVTPRIAGRLVWQSKIGAVGFGLSVPVRQGRFFVADDDGQVRAVDAESGREVWRASAGARIVAGVGSDGRYAAVVTEDNRLVVMDGPKVLWRVSVSGRVLTAPLVAGERVFVMSVDRAIQAYDVLDGRLLWRQQRAGDPLALAQHGVLMPFRDTLVAGLGHRLTALDPLTGVIRWEVPLASPRGTNEVERLADLVGPAARVGNRVCARAFQSTVGCVDAERGTLSWSRPTGGSEPIAADERAVVASGASDRLTAWRQETGSLLWSSDRLLHRGLSGGLMAGPAVVVVDQQGEVHFLDRETGVPLLRLSTDSSAPAASPVLSGTTMLVVKRSGGLFAFRPQ